MAQRDALGAPPCKSTISHRRKVLIGWEFEETGRMRTFFHQDFCRALNVIEITSVKSAI